jgi:hypothetical protein
MNFQIGCDPEVLLINQNEFVSAIGIVEGTKEKPDEFACGKIHYDNVALEFNTVPASTVQEFVTNIEKIYSIVDDIAFQNDVTVSRDSVGTYSEEALLHPAAREAGCDPDWNVYTRAYNPRAMYSSTIERVAGGHIHIGTDIEMKDIGKLVKVLDLLIGIPMVLHDNPQRRKYYGHAGSYRVKEYGVEYRTPSNFWLFTADRQRWVHAMVERALGVFKTMPVPDEVRECIDHHNKGLAEAFMGAFDIPAIPV